MKPKQVGDVSEVVVEKRLVERGHRVSIPRGEYPYDLVVETEGGLQAVQVKTATDRPERGDVIRVNLMKMDGPNGKSKYSQGEVDAFAAYYPDNDNVYWFWFDEVPETEMCRSSEDMERYELDNRAPLR